MIYKIKLSLFNHETTWIKVAVETAIGGGELQDAVIRIGHTARIILCIALTPNYLLALGICQDFHCATKHHTFKPFYIAEVDAGLGIRFVVGHTQREGVSGKIERRDALTLARCQHSLGAGIALVIY